jgi:hypothetical protein
MTAEKVGQPGAASRCEGQAGDRVDDPGPPPPRLQLAGRTGDLKDLGGVREAQAVHGDGLEGADLHPAVSAVAGAV